jgi:hypothetical protein
MITLNLKRDNVTVARNKVQLGVTRAHLVTTTSCVYNLVQTLVRDTIGEPGYDTLVGYFTPETSFVGIISMQRGSSWRDFSK